MTGWADTVDALLAWFAREGADLPWRRTRDRYAVLVSEVMLQATPVARVLRYYEPWMGRWPTPRMLADAPLGDVLAAWHGLGYPRRARDLHRAAAVVARDGWPADLRDLPGVGPYTAAAIRCFADGEPRLPVDTNVARVLARRWPDGWPADRVADHWAAGQALMDLGRTLCTARAPGCAGCPVREGCPAAESGDAAAVTPPRRRQAPYAGSMRERRGRLLGALANEGGVPVARDPDAAASLVADGLARRVGRTLRPVGLTGAEIDRIPPL